LKIPFNARFIYIEAYQRFLWNAVVSKRLSKFGPMPIVGDLVFALGTSSDCDVYVEIGLLNEESIAEETESDQSGDEEANGDKEADGEKSKAKAQRNQRKVIFIDENNIKDYTINDIILPLPGFDTTYPDNEVAGWYSELLEADGLTEMDFKQSTKYVYFFFVLFLVLFYIIN
jgi:tRNA pseudouridine13 synthase